MNWNEWSKKLHQTSVDHGFYDKPVPIEQTLCLIHSELSEALEEMRNNKPALYFMCEEGAEEHYECKPEDEFDCTYYGKEETCPWRGQKPEGVCVEMVDAIIRILDYFGYAEIDDIEIEPFVWEEENDDGESVSVTKDPMYMLADAHYSVSSAWEVRGSNRLVKDALCDAASICVSIIEHYGEDVEELIKLKSEYNETRPHKHGKQF